TATVDRGISTNLDLAFSPDGRFLAGPGPGHTVTVLDLTTGRQRALKGHSDQVLCVAFRPPDGRLLLSAGRDGAGKFWDVEAGRAVREVTADSGEIVGMTVSPDGQLVATIGADDKVRLWDIGSGAKRFEFPTTYRDQARMVRRAAFSPNSRLFA